MIQSDLMWPFHPLVGGLINPLKGSLNHPENVTKNYQDVRIISIKCTTYHVGNRLLKAYRWLDDLEHLTIHRFASTQHHEEVLFPLGGICKGYGFFTVNVFTLGTSKSQPGEVRNIIASKVTGDGIYDVCSKERKGCSLVFVVIVFLPMV